MGKKSWKKISEDRHLIISGVSTPKVKKVDELHSYMIKRKEIGWQMHLEQMARCEEKKLEKLENKKLTEQKRQEAETRRFETYFGIWVNPKQKSREFNAIFGDFKSKCPW